MPDVQVGFAKFAVLRLPLKPAKLTSSLLRLPGDKEACADTDARLAFQVDHVLRLVDTPDIKAAISFASPGLIERFGSHDTSKDARAKLRLAMSAYKYLSRLSSRPTPFGAFASISHVRIGETTNLESESAVRLHARLDNGALQKVLDNVLPDATEKLKGLRVRLSNTVYALGGDVRSFVPTTGGETARSTLSTFSINEGLAFVIAQARHWLLADDFVAHLVDRLEVGEEEGWRFLHQLISKQILVTELQICISSGDTFRDILARASTFPNEHVRSGLAAYRPLAGALEGISEPGDFARKQVADIVAKLRTIAGGDFDGGRTVHIDAYRDSDFRIASDDLEAVRRDLADLTHLLWQRNAPIDDFKDRFREKFEDRRVPLLHALDPDGGVGYGPSRTARSPLLNGASPAGIATDHIKWDSWQQALLSAVVAAIANGRTEVELDPSQVKSARRYDALATPAIYKHPVALLVLQRSDLDGPIRAILNGIVGPSALALIGRFAGGLAPLEESARVLALSEQASSPAILAELIHLPEPRTANVIVRKRLRQHELHCGLGGVAGYDDENIPCSSLFLHLDGTRLVLTTDEGTEIQPRLASAHNSLGYQLPAYQFLSALQLQDGISRHLGDSIVLDSLPYVPRIRYRSLTLSLARWTVSASEISHLTKSSEAADRLLAMRNLRAERGFPRHITLVEGDNLLEVDLDNDLATLTMIEEILGRERAVLRESIGSMESLPIRVSGEVYRHELFLPLEITSDVPPSMPRQATPDLPLVLGERALPLDSWIHVDLFCGEASGDAIISSIVAPFVQRHEQRIDRWFFVRFYENGMHHLRVRFLPGDPEGRLFLLTAFLNTVKGNEKATLIHRCRISPYEREIDRYGGPESMELCERLFTLGSAFVADAISAIGRSTDKEQDRWRHGFHMVWTTLEDAFPSLDDRRQLARRMFDAYRAEFPAPNNILGAASTNFRRDRKAVDSMTSRHAPSDRTDHRCEVRSALITRIRDSLPDQRFTKAITSVIHMDCNRLFPYHARMNEMMIYEYANRQIASLAARKTG